MEFEMWHIIAAIGVLAFVVEVFTAGFVAGSVGVGLFLSAIGSYFSLEVKWLILLFALGVGITYFLFRPLIVKYGYKNSHHVKTNQDAFIGRKGLITEEVNEAKQTGRIKIDGVEWNARTEEGGIILSGQYAEVLAVESIVLIVKSLK